MQYRIRRFGVQSTALTVGMLYFAIGLLLVPFFYAATRSAPPDRALPGIAFVLGPFIYAVIGYIGTALVCWIYNLIAGWSGGISLALEQDGAGE